MKMNMYRGRNSAYDVLNKLKDLDRLVDFARARIQLCIMLFFFKHDKGSLEEIAEAINERKKAVRDALIKLERKGLVVRNESENAYKPTSLGKRFIVVLNDVLKSAENPSLNSSGIRLNDMDFRSVASQLIAMRYIYDVIVYIGSSYGGSATMTTISSLLRLSPEVAESYMDRFPELFVKQRRRRRTSPFSGRKKLKTIEVRLSKKGMSVYYTLPEYLRLKKSLLYKVLRFLTRTGHLRVAYKRLLMMENALAITMIIALFLLFKTPVILLLLPVFLPFLIMMRSA